MNVPISPQARWISGPEFDYGADDALYYEDHRNHVVRGTFALESVPDVATLSIAVLGYARVSVNGRAASDEALVGDWTNFSRLVTYRCWDVSELLAVGDNEVEVELGNGFYNPAPLRLFGKYNLRERLSAVGTPCVLASLSAGDGQTLLATGESWDCTLGQLTFNNPYLGERRDLRLRPGKPMPVVLRDPVPAASIEPAQVEPVRGFGHVDARVLPGSGEKDGALVVDLGQMVTGFANLAVRAREGAVVRVSYAEHLDGDGRPDFFSNLAGLVGQTIPHAAPDGSDVKISGGPGAPEQAREVDEFICADGVNRFEGTFSTHSFRYALVEGVSASDLLSFGATPVHTDLRSVGRLETDNGWYNELLAAALRTKLNNVHGIWEDCARERLGYGGDMVALAASNLASFDCEGLIRKTVRDFRNDQTSHGGVPETAPYVGIQSMGTGEGEGPLLWQVAYPYLVLQAHRLYGCDDLVVGEWPYVRRLVDYLLSRDPEELSAHCLGDHGSIRTAVVKPGDWKGGTPDRTFTSWCAILWFCRMAQSFCRIMLGLGDDIVNSAEKDELSRLLASYERHDRELVGEIRSRFEHGGGFGDLTQTSYAFAGNFGLMGVQQAGDALARLIRDEGDVLSAGIFGASFAWRILHESGHDDAVEAWLNREDEPSYHAMLSLGSGTLTEQFNPDEDSYNHAMFSSYVQWMYGALAGIEVESVGDERAAVRVSPYFSPKCDHVRASLETRAGVVEVEWRREEGSGDVALTVDAPESVGLDVSLPAGWGSRPVVDGRARVALRCAHRKGA